MDHLIDAELLNHRVQVHLVGVGGNGAQMAACLARLDIAMKALGHPGGLHVKAFDADRVSEANVGRQLYSRADVGRFKSLVTIHRLNQFYGLDWDAYPFRYEEYPRSGYRGQDGDLVVSCVDTRSARRGYPRAPFRTVFELPLLAGFGESGNDRELRSRAAAARASAQAGGQRAAPTVRHGAFPRTLGRGDSRRQ